MTSPIAAQDASARRTEVNAPVVGILGAGINGQMTQMLWDISRVTSQEGEVRVLPILGGGSLSNINDLLYLRGVDGAMIQSDVLTFYERIGVEEGLERKLKYVAPLGTQMAHLLAREDIETIDDLAGKRVNFGRSTSGTVISAGNLFDELNLTVEAHNMSHRKALKAIRNGELDAMFWMTAPPADLLQSIAATEGLHLLSIPPERIADESYEAVTIQRSTYENLTDQNVATVGVKTLLAVYNWPAGHERYAKVKRFADAFRAQFDVLKEAPYHPVFQTVDLTDEVPGQWVRFE
ncbi:MAG: TAXI family TRAP transporter solute-binding subunit [Pseudomonadota bacterium]